MANLKQVTPSLIGQTQTAQRSVRMVQIPNPGAGAGDAIKSATKGLLSMADSFANLLQERDEADYKVALNDAIAELNERLQNEVYSQEGFAAEGAAERADGIYKDIFGKYSGKLSGGNSRKLAEYWGSLKNSQMPRIMSFERSNLQKAELSANQTILKNEVGNYVSTGDTMALNRALIAYDDNYRITNGRLVTRKMMDEIYKDYDDGDGKIKLPDGRTLRIVEKVEPGEKDAITKEQLSTVLYNLDRQADQYEAGKQNLFDSAHAMFVDSLLQRGTFQDITAAERYLGTVSAKDAPHGISKGVLDECRSAVARKKESYEIYNTADALIKDVHAKAGNGTLYGSAEQDEQAALIRKHIMEKNRDNPEYATKLLRAFNLRYSILRDQQAASLNVGIKSNLLRMQNMKMDLPQQEAYIRSMKDSPLKDALWKAYDRNRKAYEQEREDHLNTPEARAEQERKLNRFKLDLEKGSVKLDGVPYNLGNRDDLVAYIKMMGLSKKNQQRAYEYANNSAARVDANLVAGVLGSLTGVDGAKALDNYPFILRELDLRKGTAVIDPKNMRAWVRENLADILATKVSRQRTGLDTSNTLMTYVKEGHDANLLYVNHKQLVDKYRRFHAAKARQRGDWKSAAKIMDYNPTIPELTAFARERGYRPQNEGNEYYINGRKQR